MYIHSVYFNPANNDNEIVIVRDSNSVWAGIFNIFWAAYKRLWPAFLTAALMTISFEMLAAMNMPIPARSLELILIGTFYFFAYDIECYCLERKGYKLKEILLALDEDEAELKFLTLAKTTENETKNTMTHV